MATIQSSQKITGFSTHSGGNDTLVTTETSHGLTTNDQITILAEKYYGDYTITVASTTSFIINLPYVNISGLVGYWQLKKTLPETILPSENFGDYRENLNLINWRLMLNAIPVGSILPYAGASETIDEGWLLCDGTAKSRTTYSRLFNKIGTSYGNGDGSTTFNIPNFQSRLPIGVQAGVVALAATGGSFNHVHTSVGHTHSIPAHKHQSVAHGHGVGTLNIPTSTSDDGRHVHTLTANNLSTITTSEISNHTHTVSAASNHTHHVFHNSGASGGSDLSGYPNTAAVTNYTTGGDDNVDRYVLKTVQATNPTHGITSAAGSHNHTNSSAGIHTHTIPSGNIAVAGSTFDGPLSSNNGRHGHSNFQGSVGAYTLNNGDSTVDTTSTSLSTQASSVTTDGSNPPYLAINFIIKY